MRAAALAAMTALAAGSLAATTTAPAHAVDEVRGTVVDASGNGVSGSLTVYSATGGYVDNFTVGAGRLAATLPPGNYKFQFYPYDQALASEYYLDKPTLAAADVVSVAPTATLQPWVIDAKPSVVGAVKGPGGQPLAGYNVRFYDTATGNDVGSITTDEAGAFAYPTTVPSVKVYVEPRGKLVGEFYNDKFSLASADAVTPVVGGANLGDIVLDQGGQITGTVTSDAGAPLQRISVCASGDSGGCDYTNAAGVYVIEGVPAGTYTVNFADRSEEYLGEYYNNVTEYTGATPVAVAKGQVVGLGPTTLTPNPTPVAGAEMTGKVVDENGAPRVGVSVTAYTPAAEMKDAEEVESAYTRQDGTYYLTKLDGVPNVASFKVVAEGFDNREDDTYGASGQWSGGSRTITQATPVALVAGGTATQNFTQITFGGIEGSVTSETPGKVLMGGYVALYAQTLAPIGGGAQVQYDSTFEDRNVQPGTYLVRFGATEHAGEWWNNQVLPAKAKLITVKSGQSVTGLNAQLTQALKAVERPTQSNYPWVGKALTVDRGVWNEDGQFTYSWLVGGTSKGVGTSYTPTKADIGKKIVVQVTNEVGERAGMATTKGSAKVGYQPKIKIKGKGTTVKAKIKVKKVKGKKVKGTLIAKQIVKVKPNGEPKYKKVGKAKVKKGKATLKLKLKGKGKKKVVFFFKGKGKAGSAEVTKKIGGKKKK